jgi:serine/threonine protein kinase
VFIYEAGECDLLELCSDSGHKFSVEDLFYILESILVIFEELLRNGMAYGDMKPENLIIKRF